MRGSGCGCMPELDRLQRPHDRKPLRSLPTPDAFLRLIGADSTMSRAATAITPPRRHILHLGETKAGEPSDGHGAGPGGDDKRLHLFIQMTRDDGTPLATGEQMLLHVDMKTRRRPRPPRRAAASRVGPCRAAPRRREAARTPGVGPASPKERLDHGTSGLTGQNRQMIVATIRAFVETRALSA